MVQFHLEDKMPFYKFVCDCGHEELVKGSMSNPPTSCYCLECGPFPRGKKMRRVYGARIETFKPYTTDHFNGEKIEVTSRRHRDELCSKHGWTYDSGRYVRKPRPKSQIEDLTWGEVKHHIDTTGGARNELVVLSEEEKEKLAKIN